MATEPTGREEPEGDGDPQRMDRDDAAAWDDVVLDESFVRGAEVREPAARTRMLRERWKDETPGPQPWRSDTPPAGWIHDSSPRRRQRSAKPRRRRWFRRKGSDGTGE